MPRSPAVPRRRLDALAALQDGVVTRHQLREHGYDDDAVRAHVTAGRWRVIGRRVVVLHTGELSERQRWWVAVLAQHVGALAGVSAARHFGLDGFDEPLVDVLIPHGARPHELVGVRVHRSREFSAHDVHPGRSLPTVRVERALTDAAAWSRSPRLACAFPAAGVQQQLTTAERLEAELRGRPLLRHHALLCNIAGDIAGGAQSFNEIDLGRIARRAGLPPPLRQTVRRDRAGRRRWLDADFGGFFAEVDGAVHLKPIRYWDDMARQNDLILVTGKPILRFSTIAIRLLPAVVEEQLAAAARRFGSG